MAVNPTKFLPKPKIKSSVKTINVNSFDGSTISRKSFDGIVSISKTVIKIDSLLKDLLSVKRKEFNLNKRNEEKEKFSKRDEKLEEKPDKKDKKSDKKNLLPKMGIFDFIKNFISNVVLGYFSVKFLDQLPKLKGVLTIAGKAFDFVIDWGGKILNAMVSLVDWGYKAYDATRGFIKNTFGENQAKSFDQFSGALNKFINLAIIAGMIAAGSGGLGGGGRGKGSGGQRPRPGQGGRPRVTTSGGRGVGRIDLRNPLRSKPKVTGGGPNFRLPGSGPKVTTSRGTFAKKGVGRLLGKGLGRVPIVGGLIDFAINLALGEDLGRATARAAGSTAGSALGGLAAGALGSVIPGAGTIAGGIIGAALGGLVGDIAAGALYDALVGGPKQKKAKGGPVTRGGKILGSIKRGGKSKKSNYRRKVGTLPRKPEDIIINPGEDVGGEEKIFGLFPKPKLPDVVNPFKAIENAGKTLGSVDYFGPIFATTAKIILGQKPEKKDYENIGLGINLMMAKGFSDGQLKGGVAAAFAEGGYVDPEILVGDRDISSWVAYTAERAVSSNAEKTIRKIQDNLRLKKTEGQTGTTPTSDESIVGTGSLVGNTNAEKVFNYLIGAGFTEQAAAGIIGNLMQESGVNPKSKQLGGGPGRGIMQWGTGAGSGGRWDALVAWAASSGKDPWALDTQVQWMMKEMRSYGTYNRLKGVTDVKKAVEIFEKEMEKAGVPNYPRRYQYAADALASFGGGKAGGGNYKGEGAGGTFGTSNFIQGNSGASYGIHYHIAPGSYQGGDITSSKHNADARNVAFNVFKAFQGKKTIYLGRSGWGPDTGKGLTDNQIRKLISSEQIAHTARGSQGGIDLQVGGTSPSSTKVAFPMKVEGMKYRPGGFGVTAKVVGSNASVAHGRYDGNGKLAPQEGEAMYRLGGRTKDGAHLATIGEEGTEYVIDANSFNSTEKIAPGLLDVLNYDVKDNFTFKKNFPNILEKLGVYEEDILQPPIIVMQESNNQSYESSNNAQTSDLAMPLGENEYSSPFDILEMNS